MDDGEGKFVQVSKWEIVGFYGAMNKYFRLLIPNMTNYSKLEDLPKSWNSKCIQFAFDNFTKAGRVGT